MRRDPVIDVYGTATHKISKDEWHWLNDYFQSIEEPCHNEFFATGDHYELLRRLRELGFKPKAETAQDVWEFAQLVLLEGFDD